MKLAPDASAASWLEALAGGSDDFDWDAGNRAKNRKHGVEPRDVEAMFRRPRAIVFAGRIEEPVHTEPRWLVLGKDGTQRRLALILTRRGERVRAISCRPMRPKEKQAYEEAIGQQQQDEGQA
jgi:uncharacterized DUF497 family protein